MYKFLPGYLKEKREAAGLNPYKLEKIILEELGAKGITRMTIIRVESGAVDPRISTVLAICSALNIAPGSIFKRMENGNDD